MSVCLLTYFKANDNQAYSIHMKGLQQLEWLLENLKLKLVDQLQRADGYNSISTSEYNSFVYVSVMHC